MSLLTVHIDREPLLQMLAAAVEVYPRECFGFMFGRRATQRTARFTVASTFNCAALSRRTSAETAQSIPAADRLFALTDSVPRLYPYLGFFHSHTGKTPRWQRFGFSNTDARNMADEDFFGVVVTVRPRSPRYLRWCLRSARTRLRGSLGAFDFHVTAHALVRGADGAYEKDEKGNLRSQRLLIRIAPVTLRALNRTLR